MHHAMRAIAQLAFVFFGFVTSTFANTEPMLFLSVPFQNVLLNPNQTIISSYSFGQYPIIFCYENNLQSIGVVTWPYQSRIYSAPLSLTLVTNGQYQGQFANANGTLTVLNNQTYTLVVSCVYGL